MRNVFRRILQLTVAASLTYLLLRQDFATAKAPLYAWLGWLDPLTGLGGLLRGSRLWPALLSLTALAVAVCWGRLFCGWFCPVGTVLDLIAAGKRLHRWRDWRPGPKSLSILSGVRWLVFGGVVGLVLGGYTLASAMDPLVLWGRDTHQLFLHLVPWSLGALILMGLIGFPRFWCRFLCPTGSALALAARIRGRSRTVTGGCTKCGICVRQCPMVNIAADVQFGADCLSCGVCERKCPKRSQKRPEPVPPVDEGRRELLLATGAGLGLLVAAGFSSSLLTPALAKIQSRTRLLRPPGALAEEDFKRVCDRCGQCLLVCPTKCLVPTGLESGLAGFWTPRFVPRRGRCMLCDACDQVCPTGALALVTPAGIRMGTAEIRRDKCVAWTSGRRCFVCIEVCSKFAVQANAESKPVVIEDKCVGCGACEANCPAAGAAIQVVSRGEIRRPG